MVEESRAEAEAAGAPGGAGADRSPPARSGPPWRSWLARALDLVYPTRCLICDQDFAAGRSAVICGACEAGLVPLPPPLCSRCGQSLASEGPGDPVCLNCAGRTLPFEWAVAFGAYQGILREAIHRFKFLELDLLAGPLGERLIGALGRRGGPIRWDAIIPIPASRDSWWLRARNPAEILARSLGMRLAIPVHTRLLRKTRVTPPQSALPRAVRLANLVGSMEVDSVKAVTGMSLLIVDDILTTGATATEAARALMKAGARQCHVATLAR